MTITLITPDEHAELLNIQKSHQILTYQNKGFDTFDKSKMTDSDKAAFAKVSDILKKSIVRFREFQNFKITSSGELSIRFQYGYDERFTGVGYILLDELLNGFRLRPSEILKIKNRLEYLRTELREERISMGELAELQNLAKHIDPSDVELLEAAGVPENND